MRNTVKYENIMFENDTPDAEIKVIDFGLSKKFVSGKEDDVMTEGVGTIYTMAPQVLQVRRMRVYSSSSILTSHGKLRIMISDAPLLFLLNRILRFIFVHRLLRRHFLLVFPQGCVHVPSRSLVSWGDCVHAAFDPSAISSQATKNHDW